MNHANLGKYAFLCELKHHSLSYAGATVDTAAMHFLLLILVIVSLLTIDVIASVVLSVIFDVALASIQ